MLLNEEIDFNAVEMDSKNFVKRTFNFEKDVEEFRNRLLSLIS